MVASVVDDIANLAEQIEQIIERPDTITGLHDDGLRRRLREAGRKLGVAMEIPGDTIHRIINTVSESITGSKQ